METFGNVCVAGHDLKILFVEWFFNCIAKKNLVKEITAKANATSQHPS